MNPLALLSEPSLFAVAVNIGFVALSAALLLAFVRLVLGPSLPDRVVALDLIALLAVSFVALYTIVTGEAVFLDAAIALALIAFLGTVAFARYTEQSYQAEQDKDHE
jgi:multicomponent Na+:H+ antiporter subunit F